MDEIGEKILEVSKVILQNFNPKEADRLTDEITKVITGLNIEAKDGNSFIMAWSNVNLSIAKMLCERIKVRDEKCPLVMLNVINYLSIYIYKLEKKR